MNTRVYFVIEIDAFANMPTIESFKYSLLYSFNPEKENCKLHSQI